MLVKEVMSREPRSIRPEASITEAMSLMHLCRTDGLPVAVDNQFVGFVLLHDLLAMFFPDRPAAQKNESGFGNRRQHQRYMPNTRTAVKQLMVSTSRSIGPNKSVNAALDIMLDLKVSQLAVTDNGRLVGMVSLADVNKAVLGITSPRVAA